MEKVLFIYNPRSGESHILVYLDYIIDLYQQKDLFVVPFRFGGEMNEASLDELMREAYRHILISGGDGTVNFVVNRMMALGVDTPIAVLPAGTANDFAKMLGNTSGIKDACERILAGKPEYVDIGKVNGSYFINVLSAGLFTDISQKTPTVLKNTFGKLAYYMNSIQELPRFKKMKLKIVSPDGIYEGDALIFFVFNGRTAGNLNIAHKSDETDGMLDVIVVQTMNPVDAFAVFVHFLKTGNKKDYPNSIYHFQTARVRIETEEPVNVDVDGEQGPLAPLEVECVPRRLRVIR